MDGHATLETAQQHQAQRHVPSVGRTPRHGAVTALLRGLVCLLLVTAPVAGALVALRYAPPAHTDIAGQRVAVEPIIGKNTVELQGGAIVRPEHARIPVLGKDIGLDIDADWNRVIPQDEQTRRYLTELWDDPAPAMERIRSAAMRYLLGWGLIGFGSILALEVITLVMLRQRRRKLATYSLADAELVRAHNARLRAVGAAFGVALIVLMDVLAGQEYAHNEHHVVVPSPVFAGTALAGTEVNGLLGSVVPFLSILEPHSPFYDRVSHNLDAAVTTTPGLRPGPDDAVFIVGEDLEDVNGMARILGRAADDINADFIAYTGDLTFAGKAIESYLIDTIDYYSGHIPVVFAPGLHDTGAIVQAAHARGWHVADGKTFDIAGVSVLPVADPRISNVGDFGIGTVLRDPGVDVERFIADTTEEACSSHPDFVFLHDHLLGRQIARQGCQSAAVVDGRSYRLIGAQRQQTPTGRVAVEFTQGSTGGHTTTAPDPGNIQHRATFEAFLYDKATGATHYSVFTVRPDGTVTITPPAVLVP